MHITPAALVGSHRLSGVEFLRGIAAVMVMLAHGSHIISDQGQPAFGSFWQFGRSGVDFFFILSGFIITFIHADDIEDHSAFGVFWLKRLLRIFPLYLIISVGWWLLLVISPSADRSERDLLHVLASLVLWPEAAAPVLSTGWSLRNELIFYALFSVLIMHKRLGQLVLGVWFAFIFSGMVFQFETGAPPFGGALGVIFLRGFNLNFLFGIAVALILRRGACMQPRLLLVVGALLYLATGMFESYGHEPMNEWPVRNLLYAMGGSLILAGTVSLDMQGRITPRFAIRLGAASYSIYLVHTPSFIVLGFLSRQVPVIQSAPPELRFTAIALITLVIGIAISEKIEQPMLRIMRRKLLPPRRVA